MAPMILEAESPRSAVCQLDTQDSQRCKFRQRQEKTRVLAQNQSGRETAFSLAIPFCSSLFFFNETLLFYIFISSDIPSDVLIFTNLYVKVVLHSHLKIHFSYYDEAGHLLGASLMAQRLKRLPATSET